MENAIKQGVLQNESGGTIRISIKRGENCIRVKVIDDGPGFTDMGHKGVGISNINSRLRKIYDTQLTFISNKKGTEVYYELPIIDEND